MHVGMYVHACVCIYIYIYIYTHTHTYIHRHIHTYIHTYITNSYLHRFKIIKAPTCPCGNRDQNIDHIILECKLLNKGRNILKQSILKTNDWPTNRRDLIKKHIKYFMKFTNTIPLDGINA